MAAYLRVFFYVHYSSYLYSNELSFTRKVRSVFIVTSLDEKRLPGNIVAVSKPRRLLEVDIVAIKFMQHLLVLITFGLCCPPLCLAIGLSIYFSILESKALIGRFISIRMKQDKESTVNTEVLSPLRTTNTVVTNQSNRITTNSIFYTLNSLINDIGPCCYDMIWVVAWSSCFFFIFLCWDIAGDEVGLENSYWVPIVAGGIVAIFQIVNYLFPQNLELVISDSSSADIPSKGLELSTLEDPIKHLN